MTMHSIEENDLNLLKKDLSVAYQDLMDLLSTITLCRHKIDEVIKKSKTYHYPIIAYQEKSKN